MDIKIIDSNLNNLNSNLVMTSSSESKNEEYIRFGQIIRIHGHKCLQIQPTKDQPRGMIVVKGFTDKDAKYITFKSFKDCEFYRKSLFQILPRGSFDHTQTQAEEARKLKEYTDLIQLKMGEYVKFGQDVVFKHVDSHQYLSGSVRCSDGGLGAFKVELSPGLQVNLVFKLYPFRSFEKEGDRIKLQSPLRIKNISNRCYISTEKNNLSKYNIVTTYSQNFTWLIHLHQGTDSLSKEDQIRTHDLIFLVHTKNDGYLCQQEIDRQGGSKGQRQPPTIVKVEEKKEGEYPFYTSLWEIEKLPVPQITPYRQSEDKNKLGTEGTYTLRQVLTGEYLQVARLSNATSPIISVDQKQITIKSAKGLPSISDYLKDKGLIKIGGPKISSEGEIDISTEYGAIVRDNLNYRKTSPFSIHRIDISKSQSEHGFKIVKIDEQSKNQVLFILSTYDVLDEFGQTLLKNDTMAFEQVVKSKDLSMIDLTLQKLIAFIKKCPLNEIQSQVLPNLKLQYICMDLRICQKLFLMLKMIGKKMLQQIYKTSKGQNDALKTVFNRAYYLVWQIIKGNPVTKLYVCEDWLDIILDHAIQNEEDTVHETLNEILQNNDDVVNKFLSPSDKNQLVQRIINVFTLKPPHQKFLNIFRASCVSGSFPNVSNQNLILNKFITKLDDIATFKLKYSQLEDFGESVDNFVPLLMFGKEGRKKRIAKIRIQCYISKDHPKERSLKEFFQDSGRLDLYQTSNYFISYLNLLADICYGKNTEAKKFVEQSLIPTKSQTLIIKEQLSQKEFNPTALDALIAILEDPEMTPEIKGCINLQRAVLRLITYAYVESADQNPVLRMNRYRNLDQMEANEKPSDQKFRSIMSFIKKVLSNFKSFFSIVIGEKDPDRKEKEQISIQITMRLYTILELLRSTLINGLWTVKEQQAEILPILLNILKNDKNDILHLKDDIDTVEKERAEFTKFKAEVSRLTPAMQLIVKCKALACQLIEIIFDFRFNNLVTDCVSFYKDLQEEKGQSLQQCHKIAINLAQIKSDAKSPLLYNAELWQRKMKIILQTSSSLSQSSSNASKLPPHKLIPLMVELSIHKNPHLFINSLKILKRHCEAASQIKDILLGLSLYDNKNGADLASYIANNRRLLNKLEEESLLYSKERGAYNSIMNFLVWLSESIKLGANLQKQPNYENYSCIFDHFNEESRIDRFHQRLIKNSDLHSIMQKFLSLSKQELRNFSDDAKLCLKYVYRFLTLLVKNFKEGKKELICDRQKIKSHARQECKNVLDKTVKILSTAIPLQEEDIATLIYKTMSSHSKGDHHRMIAHVRKRDDCEAIQLLAQLYTDNKQILYDDREMESTTVEISIMVNEVPIQNYYKTHVLDFLRSLIYYKDKAIPLNQSRILAKLQDSKKVEIFYRFDKNEPEKANINGLNGLLITDKVVEWEKHNLLLLQIKEPGMPYPLRNLEESPVVILPELTYFIALMNLFANLVEGGHTVNIGKCRQVHQYLMLMGILKDSSICYPLKTHLRNYINQLYYSTSIEEDLCSDIIKSELPLLIDDLNTLIVILSKKRVGKFFIVHPIRYLYFDTYIYLYLEQIGYTLNYLLNDSIFMNEIKKDLANNYSRCYYYLHYFIMRIYERLRWLLNYYYEHKYMRGFLNKITKKLKDQFLIDFKINAYRVFDRTEEKLHDPKDYNPNVVKPRQEYNNARSNALKKRCQRLIHKLVEAQIGNYFTEVRNQKSQNFPLTFFLPYDQEEEGVQKEEPGFTKQEQERKVAQKLRMMLFASRNDEKKKIDYHNLRLQRLDDELNKKESFRLFMANFVWKEFNQLYQIDSYSKQYYQFKQKFVSFEEYIKIFVEVNTSNPKDIPTDLKKFFFYILLQYIVQHKTENRLQPIQTWQKNDWQGFKDDVRKSQDFLWKSNVAQLLIQTLKSTEDIGLILIVLQFGVAYLLGGNTNCQNSILQKLKQDKKNQVFIKIKELISKLGKKISSKIAEITLKITPRTDQFVVQPLDRYDYYEPRIKVMKRFGNFEEEKDQISEELMENRVFGCLFKFLQLLCQCNNFAFKDFVREQIDNDNQKKNNSFNILSMTTFEIRRLFKVMDRQASVIILPLTDFLNQVVTLPCYQNQLSLCQTTFFQDLCYMASFFKIKTNLKARKFDRQNSLQRLFELYQKCILIILNILQGNDSQLNKAFLNKLDVKFLLGIMEINFQKLGIKTKEDLQFLLKDAQKQEVRVPLQLENAMNVMIVLLKLEESPNKEIFFARKEMYLRQKLKTTGINLKAILDAMRQQILKIEIVSSRGKQFIYFPQHPILTKLSASTRNRIMEEVSRATQREKIKSLLQFKEEIFAEIQHNFQVEKEKFLGISISPAKILELQSLLFYIAYIIIIIWSFTTSVIIQYSEVIYHTPRWLVPFLKVLDGVQLAVSLLHFCLYYKCKFKLAQFRFKKEEESGMEEEQKRKKRVSLQELGQEGVQIMEQRQQQPQSVSQNRSPTSSLKQFFTTIVPSIASRLQRTPLVILSLYDDRFIYTLMFLLTSFFGTFFFQALFTLYIIYYFMLHQSLQNIFKSIFSNIKPLASVGVIGIVFIYVFSLIFYQTYALEIMEEKDPYQRCDTIYNCVLDLYVSGNISGSVQEFNLARFGTDIIYYVFFGLLFGNIVQTIMIDSFNARRQMREQMNDDKRNRCYICGQTRGDLQKADEKFDDHIKKKHFLWNYIYYLYCLQNKNQTEYTGLEYEIKTCINSGQNEEAYIKWIPFGGVGDDEQGERVRGLNSVMEDLLVMSRDKAQRLGRGAAQRRMKEEGQEE